MKQRRDAGLAEELAALGEALEGVAAALQQRGASMTDTSPLVRVKAALTALRGESKALDLQLGVLGHAVMQSRVAHRHRDEDAQPRGDSGGAPR